MKYYSTNRQAPAVNFKEATINGQAPDKGLYFPEFIPVEEKDYFRQMDRLAMEEVCFRAIRPYTGDTIPQDELFRIVSETVNFPIPLIKVHDGVYTLELYHGNTMAFKDIGARFMSRCLGYFVKGMNKQVTVLVATSGDTGGAVADGFYGIDGVRVVILYPKGKVSRVQEKQLTTYGGNIQAIAVEGNFDDCQRMVKLAFADDDLTGRLFLTSANSINVARWLPQQFFYYVAWMQWADKDHPPVISVPSGNFGNICAGLLARQSGLPISHYIAACNANKVVPQYLSSGQYKPQQAIATLSNAMDVGDPSNFVRIQEIFSHDIGKIKQALTAFSYSDQQTIGAIQFLHSRFRYLADPHGAVGYLALTEYLAKHPGAKGIFMETAHPVKFYDAVEPLIGMEIDLPEQIRSVMEKEEQKIQMPADYASLKDWLLGMN